MINKKYNYIWYVEKLRLTFIVIFLDKFRNNNNHVLEGLDNLKEIIEEKKPIFVSGHFQILNLCLWKYQRKSKISYNL